jgi:hypothetical protein
MLNHMRFNILFELFFHVLHSKREPVIFIKEGLFEKVNPYFFHTEYFPNPKMLITAEVVNILKMQFEKDCKFKRLRGDRR